MRWRCRHARIETMPLSRALPMYLCDTNIISELARPVPNAGVSAWAETVVAIHLSVVSVSLLNPFH